MAAAAARQAAQVAAEKQAAYDAAKMQSKGDVDALDKLLEDPDADPEAIREAVARIGAHESDPVYAEALLDNLGPDGLNDLYDDLGKHLRNYNDVETVWPALKQLDNTVALGLAQCDDAAVAAFSHTFMDNDQGAKRWALIAASPNADGRTNAVALAYSNRIYTPAQSGEFDPFTSMFNLAYGDEQVLDHLSDHSTGADLARVLAASSHGDRTDLLMEMMNTMSADGHSRGEDDFKKKASLFGDALAA